MGAEIILDGVYRKVPAGWVRRENIELGTVRMIEGVLHFAY